MIKPHTMKKKRILVIDDFEPLLEEIYEFLSFEGFDTYSAKNGSEGVQMALQHKPDLIICDIEMPKMNGFEVYKTLEKIPAISSVPFIFLTARAQADDFRAGLSVGADDYITKPLDLDNLLSSISKRLNKHDQIKQKQSEKFEILLQNPLTGTFIYTDEKFIMVNEKFKEITGYSRNEMNKIKLSEIILGEKDQIISKLKNTLNNIYESTQLQCSFIDKNKKAIFVDLFAKFLEIDSKNALIGTIVEMNDFKSDTSSAKNPKQLNEFNKVVDYLISAGKDEIAEEILNVNDLLSFEKKRETHRVKKQIKLTKRENEILSLICEGYTNAEIAEKLFISNRTVDNHRANLLSKTGAKNTASLVAFAFKNSLILM